MLLLYLVAVFGSAALVFLVQPLIAKMFLPLLGGSPSVWNTCMVFFQTVLLGGYLYAHAVTRLRRLGSQLGVHGALLLAGAVALPVGLPADLPEAESSPAGWLAVVALRLGRGSLLCPSFGQPASPEMPVLHRTPRGPGPLLPLCGKQRREPPRRPRLSHDRGAPDGAGSATSLLVRELSGLRLSRCGERFFRDAQGGKGCGNLSPAGGRSKELGRRGRHGGAGCSSRSFPPA